MRGLDARCRVLGVSRAEGVRRAVDAFLNVKYGLEEEGFGLWTHSGAAEGPSPGTGRSRLPKGKAP
jgi:hypothetical protein